MKLRYVIFVCFAVCSVATAQTATELFNPAAREYIYNNTVVASNLVTKALQKFPDDEKLLKLKELIEQQQQQNQQQQDQQNQQSQQDQKNQEQSDSSVPSESSDPQKQQPEEQQSEEQKPQDQQPAPAQPQQAGEMSEEEAKQLLDAMKQNEKDQRQDLRPYLGPPVRVRKNW
jgi:hypothetical protein